MEPEPHPADVLNYIAKLNVRGAPLTTPLPYDAYSPPAPAPDDEQSAEKVPPGREPGLEPGLIPAPPIVPRQPPSNGMLNLHTGAGNWLGHPVTLTSKEISRVHRILAASIIAAVRRESGPTRRRRVSNPVEAP
jgi:hypothetical protein